MGTIDTYFMDYQTIVEHLTWFRNSMDMTLRQFKYMVLDIKSTTGNLQLSSGTQIDIGNNSGVLLLLQMGLLVKKGNN